jgi:flavin reductase (DIM6/NTAB) family NADH-FMN oxidoreductase RutF
MPDNFSTDPEMLRNSMRRWVTGVTIVTSVHDGDSHGMTVNSFNSVSLNPPMICVTLARDTYTYQLVEKSGVFGVTILGAQHEHLSNRFAGRMPELLDRFEGLDTFKLQSDVPFIEGGEAFLDCQVVHRFDAGENVLLIALVQAASIPGSSSNPLVYYQRRYWNLSDPEQNTPFN